MFPDKKIVSHWSAIMTGLPSNDNIWATLFLHLPSYQSPGSEGGKFLWYVSVFRHCTEKLLWKTTFKNVFIILFQLYSLTVKSIINLNVSSNSTDKVVKLVWASDNHGKVAEVWYKNFYYNSWNWTLSK